MYSRRNILNGVIFINMGFYFRTIYPVLVLLEAMAMLNDIKLPGIVYDAAVKQTIEVDETAKIVEGFDLYDGTVISGINILVAIRDYRGEPFSILVKTNFNSIESVLKRFKTIISSRELFYKFAKISK